MSTSFVQLKSKNQSRLAEEKRLIDRKRNIMILLLRHCVDNGYVETAERLQAEAGVTLSKFEVADNIDLSTIVQEYEDFHEMKFGKKPKLVRRKNEDDSSSSNNKSNVPSATERRVRRNNYKSSAIPPEARVENSSALKSVKSKTISNTTSTSTPLDLGLVGQKPQSNNNNDNTEESSSVEDRLLKPLPAMQYNDPDLQSLASLITRDIFQKNPNVKWSDVVELSDAKRLLKEAVVMPIKYPQLFTGLLSPWCGILLFGPPGTGKTMLAKAVATECQTTFFNISASSIVSKYRGDSEKLVRMLFELARYHAPSTIFLDEIDSIMGQRGGGSGQEHEASRRMKTELLIQMDGLSKSNELVFVLAASNLPWELDMAMLRRLEKRVLVTLPGPTARRLMIQKSLEPYVNEGEFNLDEAVNATDGYSGADIKLVVKEAAMGPVRRFIANLEGDEGEVEEKNDWSEMLDKVQLSDLKNALEKTKPSAFQFATRYESWQKEFGSN